MTTGDANGDQRVTNATLALKIDNLTKIIEAHTSQDTKIWEAMDARLKALEQAGAVRETRLLNAEGCLKEHDGEIDKLKSSDRKWGGVSMAIAAIITGIGALFKP